MIYYVNDVYASIQGEGALTGVPMVVLRLHGCGVGCPWCDTKETWKFEAGNERMGLAEVLGANPRFIGLEDTAIAAYIADSFPTIEWVLVTGGEPADTYLGKLVEALRDKGLKAALETSGTATGHIGAGFDWVTVSPKFGMPGRRVVLPIAAEDANEIKQVVGRQEDIDLLDRYLETLSWNPNRVVALQPVSQSKKATALCMETAMQRKGWRLSVQVHKYLDVR